MPWPRKPKTLDLSAFEKYLAEQPQSNLPATLDAHGPALVWNRPLDIQLARFDVEGMWRRIGDRAWDILQHRRMSDIFPGEPPCEFRRYLDILRRSSAKFREEIFVGLRHPSYEPILVPRFVFKNHSYVLGGSGSGKTTHAMAQILLQLAEEYTDSKNRTHPRPPIFIMDLKQTGDRYLRSLARQIADERGQELRFFSVDPEYESLRFDPFYCLRHVTYPLKRTEFFLKALSMIYPEGYGSDFFTKEQRSQLQEILYHARPTTMDEMIAFIRHATQGKSGNKDARGLYSALSAFGYAKNLHTNGEPLGVDEIIDFDRFFDGQQVIYCHLDSREQPLLSGDVGKMLLFCLLEAAAQRQKRGVATQCFVAIDEFHRLAARNIVEMLEDARGAGVGFVLAHQSSSSLKTRDADLYGTLFENCSFKQCLTLEDPRVIELFQTIAGRTVEYKHGGSTGESESTGKSSSFSTSQGSSGGVSTSSTMAILGGPDTRSISDSSSNSTGTSTGTNESRGKTETKSWEEEKIPGLTPEMIAAVNDTNLLSLMHIKGTGGRCLTPTGGIPLLVQGLYPFTEEMAAEMTSESWPTRTLSDPEWYYEEARPSIPKATAGRTKSRSSPGSKKSLSAGTPGRSSGFAGANEADQRGLEARIRDLAERLAPEMLEESMDLLRFARHYHISVADVIAAGASIGLDLSGRRGSLTPGEVRRLKRAILFGPSADPPTP
ncbi:MAG TPA: TraM recognition domain-containing protein [Phycisphaerae bacterium]|nr:TraM recognition domain-containing protein [Phycisphaerae bacterium]